MSINLHTFFMQGATFMDNFLSVRMSVFMFIRVYELAVSSISALSYLEHQVTLEASFNYHFQTLSIFLFYIARIFSALFFMVTIRQGGFSPNPCNHIFCNHIQTIQTREHFRRNAMQVLPGIQRRGMFEVPLGRQGRKGI